MKLQWRQVERDVVEEQLNIIVTSKEFARSERSIRMLRYLVDKSLGESGHVLKEYVVGVEVFGRTADFDPRCNSVVRVEATRLRKKLRNYYESAGAQDPVLISLPRGGYHARLELRQNPKQRHSGGSAERRAEEKVKSLAILPPRYSDVPDEEVKLLLDAIWRSLHLAGGLDVLPPPVVPSGRAVGRGRGVRDNATFSLDLYVRPSGEGGERVVSATIRNLAGETIWHPTHSSDTDLARCGCRIAREVLGRIQVSPAASRWYDLGRHLLYQLTPTALWNSRVCFEQVVLADGRDPRGHAALALASALLYIFDGGDPESLVERIRESAPQGIGPKYGVDAYLALAVIAWGYDCDWNEANRLLSIARNISPGDRVVRYWRALCLASAGRTEEAAEELLQTHDPHAFSVDSELALASALWLQGEYSKAAARTRWVIAAEPKNAIAHLLLGWILLADSRPQEAIEPLEAAQVLFGPGSPATAALGFATARAGRAAARDILEGLLHRADGRYQVDADAGIVHLGLGEEHEARVCLRTARAKHSGRLGILHFTPEFEAVRSVWLTALLTKSMTNAAVA
jgi:tetratricopeptide (TPR) repeat protein